jgi:hypothetical protein
VQAKIETAISCATSNDTVSTILLSEHCSRLAALILPQIDWGCELPFVRDMFAKQEMNSKARPRLACWPRRCRHGCRVVGITNLVIQRTCVLTSTSKLGRVRNRLRVRGSAERVSVLRKVHKFVQFLVDNRLLVHL